MASPSKFTFKKIPLFVSSVSLVVMMLVTVVHVIGRLFFASPLYGGVEIISLAGIFLISFALSYTQAERSHIIIEILIHRLPKRARSVFMIFSLLISSAAVMLLGWGALLYTYDAVIKRGSKTPILHLPAAPFRVILVLGCLLLLGYFALHLVETFKTLLRKEVD
ncbi:MAG: TRAP transporter small permease [Desulfobacterota bacterium]|nr:TRAP transporter small permease [Thermodesulfobacteriota bacterium]